ncbi:MAG TPA: lasso peptide biosynthesis B2 protein [Thermoanaerobaculaceae bacterium]|nr:lasso peptide biosynthesis B2 protein [Thermoanaerobaculaceae bacterium]HPS78155.1 lasso peptide biosynthesis B2 protein [Thermoanaerobaculaceae bacterium]
MPRRDTGGGRFRGPRDVLLAVRVALWLVLSTALARRAGLIRTLTLLRPKRPSRQTEEETLARARRIQRYADGLMRRRPFGTRPVCWRRALVQYRMLPSGPGREVRIFFGVQQESAGELEGHAWVELNGSAVDGTVPGRYHVTLAYPPARPR